MTEAITDFQETEIGPIPVDWDVVPFEQTVLKKRVKVGKVKKQDYRSVGKFPVVDQGQQFIAGYWDDPTEVYTGDLPVIVFGDHTRIFKFVDFPFVAGADGVKVLLLNTDFYDPDFLYFAFTNLKIPSKGYNRHFKLLKEQVLPLPPLPEQRRIAHVLSTIQRAIAAQDDLIAAAREVKRSLMQRLFTYGPGSEPTLTKETEIGEIPEHWGLVPLRELAIQFFSGGTPSTKRAELWDGHIPWTTSAYIEDLYLDKGARYITAQGLEQSSAKLVPQSNLLIGTRVGVGKVAINSIDIAISQDLTGVIVDKTKVHLEFLAYAIQSDGVQTLIRSFTRGTTIKGIPRKDLAQVPISLPPLKEQRSVAHALQTVDRKIEAEEQRKAALQALFKAMLHQLMTGQVRLKDDVELNMITR